MAVVEIDVRSLAEPHREPAAFAAYADLSVGDSLVLTDSHDPEHLREAFEIEHPRGHSWSRLDSDPGVWRVQIGKLASTALPRLLHNSTEPTDSEPDVTGVVWKLRMRHRDLDSNIIQLPSGVVLDTHHGPELDVLIHVIAGSGRLTTELDSLELRAGSMVWLPRRSRRRFEAGADGLSYLTVHQRRQALALAAPGSTRSR